uniref:DDE Tnp4 domain-containing protein n=1 Tax=Sinocyclocheilus grahami TaxID=75366 RepID=A0A672N2Z4_SINGR
ISLRIIISCLQTLTSEEEWRKTAEEFDMKWQFPHCLGKFSILSMAVVDANYRFIYTNVGVQGRVSDAGLICKLPWMKKLNFPPAEALQDTKIMPCAFVGDEAYPLRNDLLKPYPHRRLQSEQRIFNYRLSRARRVVENVFRTTICLDPDKAVTITLAALCLHNFLRHKQSDPYVPPGFTDWEDENHQLHDGARRQERILQSVNMGGGKNPTIAAKEQCDHLMALFHCMACRGADPATA